MSLSLEKNNDRRSDSQKDLDLLKEIPFFASFPIQALKILAYLCNRGSFEAGEKIIEQGDDNQQAIFVISGSLLVVREENSEEKELFHFSEGDFFGGTSLLGSMQSLFTVKADNPTKVLTIDRHQFQKLAEQFPEVTQISVKSMLNDLHRWEQKCITELTDGNQLQKIGVTLL